MRPLALAFRFRADRRGAAAVEFAIVLPLFLSLTLATFEAGWTMTKVMLLERAVDKSVRELRIGRKGGFTHRELASSICGYTLVYEDCAQNLRIELVPARELPMLPGGETRCRDSADGFKDDAALDVGEPEEIVLLRACLLTKPLTPGLGYGLKLPVNKNGDFAVIVQSIYMNEPGSRS